MKKTAIFFGVLVCALLSITGCLKDTKFENHEYGITDPAGSPDGVGFTLGRSPLETRGLEVSNSAQTVRNLLIANLFAKDAASSDVNVTLVTDTNLVNSYNATNGTSFLKLPSSLLNLSKPQFTIRAGQRIDTIPFSITSTTSLNPNNSYAVGFRITAASNGYNVATNYSTIVLQVNIKNKYDGVYRLQGYHNRTPYNFPYDVTMHMITAGPNSVSFYWPEVNSFGHPIGVGIGSTNWYGNAIAPVAVFNLANDQITDVFNGTPGTPITVFTGTGSGVGRFDGTVNPKKMYVYWHYNNNPLRAFFDTLTYISPRP